jgi:hypothetical protein
MVLRVRKVTPLFGNCPGAQARTAYHRTSRLGQKKNRASTTSAEISNVFHTARQRGPQELKMPAEGRPELAYEIHPWTPQPVSAAGDAGDVGAEDDCKALWATAPAATRSILTKAVMPAGGCGCRKAQIKSSNKQISAGVNLFLVALWREAWGMGREARPGTRTRLMRCHR